MASLKVLLKGGLTLFGILLMAGAAFGDIVSETPNKFQVIFYIGILSIALGVFFVWALGHD